MKSYRSNFCHTAVAVLRQYFRVQIHDFSSLKTCHQWPRQFMKLPSSFPSYESSRTPFPRPSLMSVPALAMSKVPTKPRVFCPARSGILPRFSWQGCGLCAVGLCHRKVSHKWDCPAPEATELFQIKPSYSAGLIELKWDLIILSVFRNWRRIKMGYFFFFFFYMLQCRMSLSGWRQALPALSHIWAQRSNL